MTSKGLGNFLLAFVFSLSFANAAVLNQQAVIRPPSGNCVLKIKTSQRITNDINDRGRLAQSIPIQSGIAAVDVLKSNATYGGGATVGPLISYDYLARLEPGTRNTALELSRSSGTFWLKFAQPCSDQLIDDYKSLLKYESEIEEIEKAGEFQLQTLPAVKRPAPNDPDFLKQYGLDCSGQTISVPTDTGNKDITCQQGSDIGYLEGPVSPPRHNILIIHRDTGVWNEHPDFDQSRILNEYSINVVDPDTPDVTHDGHGHGTHTAGIYLQSSNNGKFGAGSTSKNIYHATVKMFRDDGSTTEEAVIKAALWPLNVVEKLKNQKKNFLVLTTDSWGNFSRNGRGSRLPELRAAVLMQLNAGIPLINAAGNWSNNNDAKYDFLPAAWIKDPDFWETKAPLVVVGASDFKAQAALFSGYGSRTVDVFAPGVAVYSTVGPASGNGAQQLGSPNLYRFLSGTSMATPHAALVAAEVMAVKGPSVIPKLGHLLAGSARKMPRLNGFTRGGLLNLHEALIADNKPPEQISNLKAEKATYNSITLSFDPPRDYADDSSPREIGFYDVRFSYDKPVTEKNLPPVSQSLIHWPTGDSKKLRISGLPFNSPVYIGIKTFDKGGNYSFSALSSPIKTNEAHVTWFESSAKGFDLGDGWEFKNTGNYAACKNCPVLWHKEPGSGDLVYRVPGEVHYDTLGLGHSSNEGEAWSPWQTLPGDPILLMTSRRNTGYYVTEPFLGQQSFVGDYLTILVQTSDGKIKEVEKLIGTLGVIVYNEIDLSEFAGQKVRIGFRVFASEENNKLNIHRLGGVAIKAWQVYGTREDKLPSVPNGGFESGETWPPFKIPNWTPRSWTLSGRSLEPVKEWEAFRMIDAKDAVPEGQSVLRLFNLSKLGDSFVSVMSDPIQLDSRGLYEISQQIRVGGVTQIDVLGYDQHGDELLIGHAHADKENLLGRLEIKNGGWAWKEYAVPFSTSARINRIRIRYVVQGNADRITGIDIDNVRILPRRKISRFD